VNLAYGTPFRARSTIKIRRVFTCESNLIGWSDWEVILTVPESLLGKDDLEMTLIDVAYRYRAQPTENQVRALSSAGAVYGIRHIALNEKERTLRVEYDASHMSESAVAGLLRDVGIDLREKLVLA
jgi:hypothetical protein